MPSVAWAPPGQVPPGCGAVIITPHRRGRQAQRGLASCSGTHRHKGRNRRLPALTRTLSSPALRPLARADLWAQGQRLPGSPCHTGAPHWRSLGPPPWSGLDVPPQVFPDPSALVPLAPQMAIFTHIAQQSEPLGHAASVHLATTQQRRDRHPFLSSEKTEAENEGHRPQSRGSQAARQQPGPAERQCPRSHVVLRVAATAGDAGSLLRPGSHQGSSTTAA